ncbi:MAG: UDP-3-O-(3-hydroxymyristoyl)glucosamine N-acyltransferase [Mariprofundaceae bacterium]
MPDKGLLRLDTIAKLLDGELSNVDPDVNVVGVNALDVASNKEVTFLASMRHKHKLKDTKAAIILVPRDMSEDVGQGKPLLRVKDPYLGFAMLQRIFFPASKPNGKRHDSAVIDSSAKVADDVDIAPKVVIGLNVSIASGTVIGAGCIIGDDVQIGKNCLLHASVIVADSCILKDRVILQSGSVIGADGFGYAWSGSEHLKIPQVGRVVLENDVEIGANTTIDRGALGDTIIHQGVKLDNQIQVGHNVEIGAYSIMASQVGISGSTQIGTGCQIGGQTGVAGHLTIGDGCKLAAKTGVTGNLDAGGTYAGFPAMPHRNWLRISVLISRLPEIWKRTKP